MKTKADFLRAYNDDLRRTYAWASDPEKLLAYMTAVRDTIVGARQLWTMPSRGAVERAWQAIGGKGMPTLRDLRTLPDGDLDRSEVLHGEG